MKRIICDTNVWYWIALGKYSPPDDVKLVPTLFSLYELVTTEQAVTNPILLQNAIKAVHQYGQEIIPVNPFDFVLSKQSSRFADWDYNMIKNILKTFEEMMRIDFSKIDYIPEDLDKKVRVESKLCRKGSLDFVEYCNSLLPEIRKNINKTIGRKKHLERGQKNINKDLVIGFLNAYLSKRKQSIEHEHFNWNLIELFLIVTENYFKHLETSKEMKVHPNDTTDWLNMMYVEPGDLYLTFENKWRNYIINDSRTSDYCYYVK